MRFEKLPLEETAWEKLYALISINGNSSATSIRGKSAQICQNNVSNDIWEIYDKLFYVGIISKTSDSMPQYSPSGRAKLR